MKLKHLAMKLNKNFNEIHEILETYCITEILSCNWGSKEVAEVLTYSRITVHFAKQTIFSDNP